MMLHLAPAGIRYLVVIALITVAGCRGAATADPAILRISAVPDQAPQLVQQQHEALIARICEIARVTCEWVPVDSYETLVERFGSGRVDLAYFGGATFVQARHRHNAQPLAMRDIDTRFTSVLVVPLDHPAVDVSALRGARLAFGSRSSTSGHIMPRHALEREGFAPERHFSTVEYTKDHDATLRAVASGRVDAGVLNASVYFNRVAARDPAAAAVRLLWRTSPFSDYVWAARPQLSESLRARLTNAFLDLAPNRAEDRIALERKSAQGFVPAFARDFDDVRSVVEAQGQL